MGMGVPSPHLDGPLPVEGWSIDHDCYCSMGAVGNSRQFDMWKLSDDVTPLSGGSLPSESALLHTWTRQRFQVEVTADGGRRVFCTEAEGAKKMLSSDPVVSRQLQPVAIAADSG